MAGRKRKFSPRHKCGKLVQPETAERHEAMRDRGTPETQRQRYAVYGTAEPGDEVTPRELICPLARIRKHLNQDQIWAAQNAMRTYQRFAAAIGIQRINSNSMRDYVEGSKTNPMPDDAKREAIERYQDMIDVAGRYSQRGLRQLQAICHGTVPRDVSILLPTLTALADHWGMREKRVA
jgi:hypothetical protein